DVSTFKHYRTVEHQQGPASYALAPVKKNIYSLTDLRHILLGCNRRYVEYLSSLHDFSTGIRALDRLTRPRAVKGRTVKGLNFFSRAEQTPLPPCTVPALTSAASAAPTSSRWSSNPHRQLSPDTSPVSANSASLNVSPGLIATPSPAPAAPPSPLPAASLNTQSFLLSPEKSAHKFQTLSS